MHDFVFLQQQVLPFAASQQKKKKNLLQWRDCDKELKVLTGLRDSLHLNLTELQCARRCNDADAEWLTAVSFYFVCKKIKLKKRERVKGHFSVLGGHKKRP